MTGLLVVAGTVLAIVVLEPSSRARLRAGRRRLERTVRSAGGLPAAGLAGRGHGSRGAWGRRRPTSRSTSTAPASLPAPLLLDLLAALLDSGAAPTAALRMTGGVLSAHGDPRAAQLLELAVRLEQGILHAEVHAPPAAGADRAGAGAPIDAALAALADALRMAVAAGLPPAALVRRAATQERRRLDAAGRRAVRRLEVLLVLPMGLCLLPAFVLLGIAPVVIDLLTSG
jgi:hypothetical protein